MLEPECKTVAEATAFAAPLSGDEPPPYPRARFAPPPRRAKGRESAGVSGWPTK